MAFIRTPLQPCGPNALSDQASVYLSQNALNQNPLWLYGTCLRYANNGVLLASGSHLFLRLDGCDGSKNIRTNNRKTFSTGTFGCSHNKDSLQSAMHSLIKKIFFCAFWPFLLPCLRISISWCNCYFVAKWKQTHCTCSGCSSQVPGRSFNTT